MFDEIRTNFVDDATEALLALAIRDPKSELNPIKVSEAIELLTAEEVAQLLTNLGAVHMSTASAFQRMAYSPVSNPLDFMAAGLACSCITEAMAAVAMLIPTAIDRNATALRASNILTRARTIAMTSAAGTIILPGEN